LQTSELTGSFFHCAQKGKMHTKKLGTRGLWTCLLNICILLDLVVLPSGNTFWLWTFQILGELNRELDLTHRSRKRSKDLLKAEQTKTWVTELVIGLNSPDAWDERGWEGGYSYDWQLWLTEDWYATCFVLCMSLPTVHSVTITCMRCSSHLWSFE
jgi:hypothetical protein